MPRNRPLKSRPSCKLAPARAPRRERGVVVIIVLIALMLLVGLVLWVINLGGQVNRRVQVQHAADAAAQAGAGWVARSLNTVSSNNVAMARYLAVVNIMDAMPQTVQFTRIDQRTFRDRLDVQLSSGVGSSPRNLVSTMEDEWSDMLDELDEEVEQLEPVAEMFAGYDVSELTHYNGGYGGLWRAMAALDGKNQAMMDNLGELTQLTAERAAMANLDDERSAALLLPVAAEVPHTRGEFEDFRRPVMMGQLPEDIDDTVENRGPYDAVFGWRDLRSRRTGGQWQAGGSQVAGGGRGAVPIGSGASSSGGRWVGGDVEIIGYSTYGPYEWLLRRARRFRHDHLQYSIFDSYLQRLSMAKVRMLWPDEGREPREVYHPEWISDFPEAAATAEAGQPTIRETAFFVFEIKSRYPVDHPQFMSPGSWALVAEHRLNPRIARVSGWHDPRTWSVEQVAEYVWRDEWEYTVNFDAELGVSPQVNSDGSMEPQPVYRVDHFAFAGINVGDPVEISNPYFGFNPSASNAPAPMNLDSNLVADNEASRRDHLTFLAVVRHDDQATSWRGRFEGGKPYPNVVAIAQAKVFNNHSWDAWTQMWHARLEPVTGYDDWMVTMTDGIERLDDSPVVTIQEAEGMHDYLLSLRTLAPVALTH